MVRRVVKVRKITNVVFGALPIQLCHAHPLFRFLNITTVNGLFESKVGLLMSNENFFVNRLESYALGVL